MRKYLLPVIALCLIASFSYAATIQQQHLAVIAKKNAGGAPPAGHDVEETFEGTGYSLGTCGSAPCWTETGTPNEDDATPVHGGTQSLYTAGSEQYSTLDITDSSNIEFAVWVYISSTANWSNSCIVSLDDDASGQEGDAGERCINYYDDDENPKIDFGSYQTDASGSSITVAEGAWYKIWIDYNKNATSTLKVYNAAESQVGSDETITAPNTDVVVIHLGLRENLNTELLNFDDVALDYQ